MNSLEEAISLDEGMCYVSPIIVWRMERDSDINSQLKHNSKHALSEKQRMVLVMSFPAVQISKDPRAGKNRCITLLVRVAITKYHNLCSLNNINLFSHISEG